MRIRFKNFAAPLSTVLLAGLVGCSTTSTQVFEGYRDDQVWSALVAAAQSPEYDDWKIAENQILVDEAGRRVEIYRQLKRLYVTPYSDPRMEREEWRLQVVLGRDEDSGQVSVDFTARQWTIPAHAWREASRYFTQVRSMLGPVATESSDASKGSTGTSEPGPGSESHETPHASEAESAARPSSDPSAPPEQLPE